MFHQFICKSGRNNNQPMLQVTPAQLTDCSADCCLISSKGSEKEQRDKNIIQASVKPQEDNRDSRNVPDVGRKERDGVNNFLEHPRSKSTAVQQENRQQPDGFALPCLATELELKIYVGDEAASSCKQFDLNGFSWN
ncbi:unnamed protein product [Musa acuminata subsp. malaccensis]|uniref:(wild Malaysian banana) hypothetical protein n=1 Tax=Musa acuminata subsp. malaccensis TaxID=214687 RepID=A0A804JA50_MUSAM|nr:unnamed protein product [Musa acuminata subsp. malaccensis]